MLSRRAGAGLAGFPRASFGRARFHLSPRWGLLTAAGRGWALVAPRLAAPAGWSAGEVGGSSVGSEDDGGDDQGEAVTGAPIPGQGFTGLLCEEDRLLGAWDTVWPSSQAGHQSSGDSGMSSCLILAQPHCPGPGDRLPACALSDSSPCQACVQPHSRALQAPRVGLGPKAPPGPRGEPSGNAGCHWSPLCPGAGLSGQGPASERGAVP